MKRGQRARATGDQVGPQPERRLTAAWGGGLPCASMSNKRKIKPVPFRRVEMPVEQLQQMAKKAPGPVTLSDREGVYVHSFKCGICALEFMLLSWVSNRHRVGEVYCPECGKATPMLHLRAIISESEEMDVAAPNEIFRRWPWPGSQMMDDSK